MWFRQMGGTLIEDVFDRTVQFDLSQITGPAVTEYPQGVLKKTTVIKSNFPPSSVKDPTV